MQISALLIALAALSSGGTIGLAFGALQQAALRKNELKERRGELRNGWSLMPSSGARVAYLLVILVLIQVFCPMFFLNGVQWWVSAGVVLSYGWTLWRGMRRRLLPIRN